jgi:hypothetical protein
MGSRDRHLITCSHTARQTLRDRPCTLHVSHCTTACAHRAAAPSTHAPTERSTACAVCCAACYAALSNLPHMAFHVPGFFSNTRRACFLSTPSARTPHVRRQRDQCGCMHEHTNACERRPVVVRVRAQGVMARTSMHATHAWLCQAECWPHRALQAAHFLQPLLTARRLGLPRKRLASGNCSLDTLVICLRGLPCDGRECTLAREQLECNHANCPDVHCSVNVDGAAALLQRHYRLGRRILQA